jgi:hypothetical protein
MRLALLGLFGFVWLGLALFGLVWLCLAWFGFVWLGLAKHILVHHEELI